MAYRGKRRPGLARAAADTMMELTATGGSKALTLTCEKQKDWELFEDIGLSLRVVALEGGETSCVIATGKRQADPVEPGGNKNDAKALNALRQSGSEGMTYTNWLKASGLRKSTFKNARKRLLRDGLVHHVGKLYRVADTNKGQGQGQGQTWF